MRAFWIMISLLAVGCVVPELDLTGKQCPCLDNYYCDPQTNLCVEGEGPPDGGADAGVDAGSTDTGPPDAGGPECFRDDACESEVCLLGTCVARCVPQGCDPGQACDETSGHCRNTNSTCASAAECNAPEEVCLAGRCQLGCTTGADPCLGQRMCDPTTGYCRSAPRCDELAPCPDSNFFCEEGVCQRRCDAPGADPCLGSGVCMDGRCENVSALGGFCVSDNNCASGLCFDLAEPSARFCSATCGADSDCPISMSCLEEDGAHVCVPEEPFAPVTFDVASGLACVPADNSCQSQFCDGTSCIENCLNDDVCQPFASQCAVFAELRQGSLEFSSRCAGPIGAVEAGAACAQDADCQSGICNRYELRCEVPCCSDANCKANENCKVYDLDPQTPISTCQPAETGAGSLGASCTDGQTCRTGVCAPADPFNQAGPKVCTSYCCTTSDCQALGDGRCYPLRGVLPDTSANTCVFR